MVVDMPNAEKQTSAYAIEVWKNIMKEALPYLNIYPTEEIPEDMKEEVEAERQQAAQEAEGEQEPEEEEPTVPEGSLIDPQTGESVQMPDPSTIDPDDQSVLGDTPINDNLLDVKPAEALGDDEDDNPTE